MIRENREREESEKEKIKQEKMVLKELENGKNDEEIAETIGKSRHRVIQIKKLLIEERINYRRKNKKS